MDLVISPSRLSGRLRAPASKSVAQRLVILAALADRPTFIAIDDLSEDIEATIRCLGALGAQVRPTERRTSQGDVTRGLYVRPLPRDPSNHPVALDDVVLDCGESGATLRFLLPVVGALDVTATFEGSGRLPQRPISPLDDQLERHGMRLGRTAGRTLPLRVSGTLYRRRFRLPGDVSSQFVSGLLLASAIRDEATEVWVDDPFESKPYVALTRRALEIFGVDVGSQRLDETDAQGHPLAGVRTAHATLFSVAGGQMPSSPHDLAVEGDWSQAAFWLAADALGGAVEVDGLDPRSVQGDRAMMAALTLLGVRVRRLPSGCAALCEQPHAASIGVADNPDLVPPLAAVCALARGDSALTGAARLRLKESDRLRSVSDALNALGARVAVTDDGLAFEGVEHFQGGVVDAAGDHRIAMMAAICSLGSTGTITIRGAECVSKSYPSFFDDFRSLGGEVREA